MKKAVKTSRKGRMETHYSCAELAALKIPSFPTTERVWRNLVAREKWGFREEKSRGTNGTKRLYAPPPAVLKAIRKQERAIAAVENPEGLQKVMKLAIDALSTMEATDEAARAERLAKGEAFLRDIANLSQNASLSLQAHMEIAQAYMEWFVKHQPLRRSASWDVFCGAYKAGEVQVSAEARNTYKKFEKRSIQRWVYSYERGDYQALVDTRRKSESWNKGTFVLQPLLAAYAKKIMTERPHTKTESLFQLLKTAAIDKETGEILFNAPSYHQVFRFQKAWKKQNSELYLQKTHPDAWKSQAMVAYGSASEDVDQLNGRWEMDATPADWMLLDPDGRKRRYTVSCVIDVYSRRALVVVAPTPKTQTHCYALRLAILKWGVPKEIVTDNGADYQSHYFKRVLDSLGIHHRTTNPFSGEEKPHIERFIGSLNHSILDVLPNFIGHNVAERKVIEARRSFAERLQRKGEIVDFADVVDGSCTGEYLQARINDWVHGIYEQREHAGIGTTPFLKAAGWTGDIRTLSDERLLDILLARPAGQNGQRILQKKGILLDGAWFIAPDLARAQVGHKVDVYETEDLGRIVVHYEGEFLCIAECPERTGVDRYEIAKRASAVQKERLREARHRLKEETKGLPSTNDLLIEHLREQAALAGQLVLPAFNATPHMSHGLTQAEKAAEALSSSAPPPEIQQTQGLAAQADETGGQARKVVQIVKPKKSRTECTPAENYAEWCELRERQERGETLSRIDERFIETWPTSGKGSAHLKFLGLGHLIPKVKATV